MDLYPRTPICREYIVLSNLHGSSEAMQQIKVCEEAMPDANTLDVWITGTQ